MGVKVTHMNSGDGQNSYANNSAFAKSVALAALPILDDALKAMFIDDAFSTTTCLRIVDLGCSFGPNSIFIISHILERIEGLYQKGKNSNTLEFEVFFNDLPDNDFNNLFKLLSTFNKRTCSWYGLPGSFYDKLFPSRSLHFAFSCYSLHWLSQVPDGVDNNNRENIFVATTTPRKVFEAYSKQYQNDFATFLSLRSKEIVHGGRMVLIMQGRRNQDYSVCENDGMQLLLLAKTLHDLAIEGHVKMDDLHSFNVPTYFPCEKEVEAVIHDEGSFNIHEQQAVPIYWDACSDQELPASCNKYTNGKLVAGCVRSFMEPMLVSHFGSSIIDQVFERYVENAAEYLSTRRMNNWNIVISLCRK